jgi:branched-chain amino acid transport system substrate-binding protein
MLSLGLVLATGASAAEPEPATRQRDAAMEYNGPSEDLKDLTEIRLGWFGPGSADDQLHGDLWWAANLAVREENERRARSAGSGFGALPFRLLPRWSVDPWGTGVSQLARMVYDEQPLALLGSVDSATTHLAEQVVAKAQLPLVSPIATDETATLAGVSWMFSCAPTDGALARVLVDGVLGALPTATDRCAVLNTTEHESRMTTRAVLRELARRGHPADFRFELPPGVADDSRAIAAAIEAKPSVILVIADAENAARLVKAIRGVLGTVPIFGGPSVGRHRFLAAAGDAAEGVRFPLLVLPDSGNAAAAAFVACFVAERHYAPDYAAVLTYDATRMVMEAARRAGPNRARVREALAHLSPWPGLGGPVRFDGTGQNERTDLSLGMIRRGAVVRVDATPSHP